MCLAHVLRLTLIALYKSLWNFGAFQMIKSDFFILTGHNILENNLSLSVEVVE